VPSSCTRAAVVAAATILLTVVGGLSGAAPASAHAIVLESDPAPGAVLARSPEQLVLRFNTKIETRLCRVTLAAGRGAPVALPVADADAGRAAAPDRLVVPLRPLASGRYVVRYKVLSADGHITEGALRFTVSDGR
jgi:methionine-rich copper-binding protein CopC